MQPGAATTSAPRRGSGPGVSRGWGLGGPGPDRGRAGPGEQDRVRLDGHATPATAALRTWSPTSTSSPATRTCTSTPRTGPLDAPSTSTSWRPARRAELTWDVQAVTSGPLILYVAGHEPGWRPGRRERAALHDRRWAARRRTRPACSPSCVVDARCRPRCCWAGPPCVAAAMPDRHVKHGAGGHMVRSRSGRGGRMLALLGPAACGDRSDPADGSVRARTPSACRRASEALHADGRGLRPWPLRGLRARGPPAGTRCSPAPDWTTAARRSRRASA